MADFEIKRIENCDLYGLLYKGRLIATNLKMEEAINLIKEIQKEESGGG